MKMEIRDGDEIRLTGYVNVTGRDSRPIPSPQGPFIEQVSAGTFKKALQKNPNVRMLFDHDNGRELCDQRSGLSLTEDNIGLYADATFRDAEVADKARAGALRGWSFGFYVNGEHWGEDGKRYLDDIDLEEVSILDVTPAYIATSVEVRDSKHTEMRTVSGELEVIEKRSEEPKTDENAAENGEIRENAADTGEIQTNDVENASDSPAEVHDAKSFERARARASFWMYKEN